MSNERERLAEAKRKLVATLSGREVKQNGTPTGTNVGYRDMAAQIKLNQCKREMVQTLSGGKKSDGFDDGVLVMEIPQDQIQKQAAARSELRQRLAGQTRRKILQNACPFSDNSGGKSDVTKDSPITPSGVPFVGRHGYITARNGTVTLDQLLAEEREKAAEPSPSPATSSGQGKDDDNSVDGENDWSPREHQGDYSEDPDEYDADAEAANILAMYSTPDGMVRKHAKSYFLHVDWSGDSQSYSTPLARVNKVSQTIDYAPEALDAAWKLVDGSTTGIAVRAHQDRMIRIKQRNDLPLTEDQQDYVNRHMG